MVATTKDIAGNDIKILIDDSVERFIRQHAIVETINGGQKTYKINNTVYTFDDE